MKNNIICLIFGHAFTEVALLKTSKKALVHDRCNRCGKTVTSRYLKVKDGEYGMRWEVEGDDQLPH